MTYIKKLFVFWGNGGSILKTLYFNFLAFPISIASKIPVLLGRNVSLKKVGNIILSEDVRFGSIQLGLGYNGFFPNTASIFSNSGKIIFSKMSLANGFNIIVEPTGEIHFGRNFISTGPLKLYCSNQVIFGENFLVSWDVLIMDSNFHQIKNLSEVEYPTISKPVVFGNHIWVGCNTIVLAGSVVADGCVIGAGSVVRGNLMEKNSLYSVNKLTKIKNVDWQF